MRIRFDGTDLHLSFVDRRCRVLSFSLLLLALFTILSSAAKNRCVFVDLFELKLGHIPTCLIAIPFEQMRLCASVHFTHTHTHTTMTNGRCCIMALTVRSCESAQRFHETTNIWYTNWNLNHSDAYMARYSHGRSRLISVRLNMNLILIKFEYSQ